MGKEVRLPSFNERELGLVIGVFGCFKRQLKTGLMNPLLTGLSIYNNITYGVPWCT